MFRCTAQDVGNIQQLEMRYTNHVYTIERNVSPFGRREVPYQAKVPIIQRGT